MKFESTSPSATPHLSDDRAVSLLFSETDGDEAFPLLERRDSPVTPVGTLTVLDGAPSGAEDPIESLAEELLRHLGEDPDREGLLRTPHRVAKSLRELTSGYDADIQQVMNGAIFDAEGCREIILVRDIEYYSLCEHHLLPFFGRVSAAYIPGQKIIGLSKIPRLVDLFARRLQVQERMTFQIAQALQDVLQAEGVAVAATGFHLCMAMRGVAKQGSITTTTAFLGAFRRDSHRREEFFRLMESGGESAWTKRSSF